MCQTKFSTSLPRSNRRPVHSLSLPADAGLRDGRMAALGYPVRRIFRATFAFRASSSANHFLSLVPTWGGSHERMALRWKDFVNAPSRGNVGVRLAPIAASAAKRFVRINRNSPNYSLSLLCVCVCVPSPSALAHSQGRSLLSAGPGAQPDK